MRQIVSNKWLVSVVGGHGKGHHPDHGRGGRGYHRHHRWSEHEHRRGGHSDVEGQAGEGGSNAGSALRQGFLVEVGLVAALGTVLLVLGCLKAVVNRRALSVPARGGMERDDFTDSLSFDEAGG